MGDFAGVLNPVRAHTSGVPRGIPLSDLLEAHRRYPGRFLLGYCPDPEMPEASALFEAAVKMYGVRILGEWKFLTPIDGPQAIELFRTAGRLKAPVVLHLDVPYLPPAGGAYQPRWYGGTVENLERALRACPETNFIGHAPGFWREISADADRDPSQYPTGPLVRGGRLERLFQEYPNLYADISAGSGLKALQRDPAYTVEFLTRFSDRILFGRDYYGSDWQDFLATLDLPPAVRTAIMGGNAQRLVQGTTPDKSSGC